MTASAKSTSARTTGERATPLLVAAHGWLLSGRLWQPLAAQLTHSSQRALSSQLANHSQQTYSSPHEASWELWAPDLPGFGQAPRPRGLQPSLASYGRWLAAAARERAGDRPVVLLGHSLGASLALEAAPHLGAQLRGLVAIAAGGGVYQPRPFQLVRRFGVVAASASSLWRGERRAATGLLACSTGRGAVRLLPQRVAALTVPSLWIAGGRDQVMAERYVRHLAGYSPLHSIGLLPEAGHLPMQSHPAALAALIEPWLTRILRRTPQSVASPFSCSSASWA